MKKRGRIKNVKATSVDGINYRSRLEAFTSIELRRAGIKFNYEKEKFLLMDKFTYEGVSIEKRKKKQEKNLFNLGENKALQVKGFNIVLLTWLVRRY